MFGLKSHYYVCRHEAPAPSGANKITIILCLHKHVLNVVHVNTVLSSVTLRRVVCGAICERTDLLATCLVLFFSWLILRT
jgi:hypothetical protein